MDLKCILQYTNLNKLRITYRLRFKNLQVVTKFHWMIADSDNSCFDLRVGGYVYLYQNIRVYFRSHLSTKVNENFVLIKYTHINIQQLIYT